MMVTTILPQSRQLSFITFGPDLFYSFGYRISGLRFFFNSRQFQKYKYCNIYRGQNGVQNYIKTQNCGTSKISFIIFNSSLNLGKTENSYGDYQALTVQFTFVHY